MIIALLYYFFYIFVIERIFKIIIIKKMGKKGLSERMEEAREGRKETGIRRYIK